MQPILASRRPMTRAIVPVVVAVLLGACTTPAQHSASTSPAEAADAQPAASGQPELVSRRAELLQALSEAGLAAEETPEGLVKFSVTSDSSFGLGQTRLQPPFARWLESLAEVLNRFPDASIEIIGHTDSTGPDALNLQISRQRADSARNHLVGRNVAAERIRSLGWGPDQPVADNATLQGRAANRRVEIFLQQH